MDFDRWKRLLTVGARSFAALALVGLLLAACADDDDDEGGDEQEGAPTTEQTSPTAADEEEDTTATEAEDGTETEGTAEETEAEGTEAEGTEAEDGTEAEGTEAEGTEAEGTEAEGTEAEGTEAEGTEAEGTEAEDEDTTATEEEDDATGTEGETEGTAPEDGGDTAELGETIEIGDLAITVEGVTDVESMAGMVEPESGMRFIAIEATIENTGSEEISLFDVFSQMHLQDAAGEEFDADLLANALLLLEGQGLAEPRIEAGSEVSGMIGFQVPEDGEGLMLVLESDTGESVEIDLSGEE